VPAPGQGIIAIEIRAGDTALQQALAAITDAAAAAALIAERAVVDPTDAEAYARAVLGVVARACDPDLLRRVYEPLTSDVLALTGDLLSEHDLEGAVPITA
jgi:porphobilinogen deaminase